MKKSVSRFLLIGSIVFLNIVADRLTKIAAELSLQGRGVVRVIGDFFVLRYAVNEGAFLGLGGTWPEPVRRVFLIVMPTIILVAALVWLIREKSMKTVGVVGLSCLIAGGAGNVFDRIVFGLVTDFMNFGIGNLRTGILNVADLSIVVGVILAVIGSEVFRKHPAVEASSTLGAAEAEKTAPPPPSAPETLSSPENPPSSDSLP